MTYYNNPWLRNFALILLIIAAALCFVFAPRPNTNHPEECKLDFDKYLLTQPDDITCGPTSTAMILNFYGKNTTTEEVAKLTKTQWFSYKEKNFGLTSPETIPPAMAKFNIYTKIKRGNLDNIKHYISQGKPVLVIVRTGNILWHYVVVTGFTPEKVYIADPGGGVSYEMTVQDFLNCWAYTHDMDGNKCGHNCPACRGSGTLVIFPCDWCGGQGKLDPLRELLRLAEIYPHTFIVED